jgi:hypothetical protein
MLFSSPRRQLLCVALESAGGGLRARALLHSQRPRPGRLERPFLRPDPHLARHPAGMPGLSSRDEGVDDRQEAPRFDRAERDRDEPAAAPRDTGIVRVAVTLAAGRIGTPRPRPRAHGYEQQDFAETKDQRIRAVAASGRAGCGHAASADSAPCSGLRRPPHGPQRPVTTREARPTRLQGAVPEPALLRARHDRKHALLGDRHHPAHHARMTEPGGTDLRRPESPIWASPATACLR